MKSNGRRSFRPGEAALIRVDFLEGRQLLSATGKAAEVAQVDQSPAIASSATDSPSAAADAAGARTVGDSASQPAKVVSLAAADNAGDPNGSDTEQSVSHAASTVAQSRGSSPVAAGSGAASAEQSPADESASGSVPDAPAGDPAIEVASPIGAGVVPGAATAGVPSEVVAASPPASMAARPGPSMGGAAASLRASDAPTEAEVGADGALLAFDAGSAATGSVRVVYSRIRPTIHYDLGGPESPPSRGREATEAAAVDEPSPLPRAADLLTEFLPFDRARLEEAIDGFLAPLDSMGTELAAWSSPWKLIPAATMVVGAAVVTEVARRRIRGDRDSNDEGAEDLARISGYPSAWRLGES